MSMRTSFGLSLCLPSPPVSGLVTAVVIVQEERDSSERAALA